MLTIQTRLLEYTYQFNSHGRAKTMESKGKTIRKFSAAGPCLTYMYGEVTGETAKFYKYRTRDGRTGRVNKRAVHIEPCRSCRDHDETMYPMGYMD